MTKYKAKWSGYHWGTCAESGEYCYLTWHHVLFGQGRRKLSDEYDLVVELKDCWHRLAHTDKKMRNKWSLWGQRKFEENHSREEYMRVFGKNCEEEL
jgi:hypothetical protein